MVATTKTSLGLRPKRLTGTPQTPLAGGGDLSVKSHLTTFPPNKLLHMNFLQKLKSLLEWLFCVRSFYWGPKESFIGIFNPSEYYDHVKRFPPKFPPFSSYLV
ncbi:hypothetical protein Avbf_03390 [Armadillidium vulgare]|nr:hypothetical protein Avbf_03390 [Armadillidium vulgare]